MKDISQLKVTGIDSNRPPKILKEPYIDLVFELSEKAPKAWCQDFNMLFNNAAYSVKVDANQGKFVETWVRNMDEIPAHLKLIQAKIFECNTLFAAREAKIAKEIADRNMQSAGDEGPQALLNEIIESLDFGD